MIITLYNPTGEGGHQGGGVAAPVGGQILSEVLPYLEAKKDNEEQIENVKQIQVANLDVMKYAEAKKTLQELGLEPVLEQEVENEEEIIVNEQTPKNGITVNKGSKIYLQ